MQTIRITIYVEQHWFIYLFKFSKKLNQNKIYFLY
jgi:hypothetical protein